MGRCVVTKKTVDAGDQAAEVNEDEVPASRVRLSSGKSSGRFSFPIRGRVRETGAIGLGIDETLSGRRSVTVLVGDSGIGKTRLLQHALEAATSRELSTMVVAPEIESSLIPLGALIDAGLRSELFSPHQLEPVLAGASPQYGLTRLISDALEIASRDAGVVVAIDDLQWLDVGSLGAITALIRDTQGVPVYWILATRTGVYSAAHQRFMSQIARFTTPLELPPLSKLAVGTMTQDAVGGAAGPGLQDAVKKAEGLPLLVLEMLRGLEEEGLLVPVDGQIEIVDDTVPARFGTSARERLTHVSPDALRIAQIASLYGREFTIKGVLDVLDQTAVSAAPAIQELLNHEFIVDTGTKFAFRHDTVQAAAADSLPPSLRRAMGREVLHKRLHSGESVSALAAMIASVAEAGDDDSIELLFDAASKLSTTDTQGAADLIIHGARLAVGRTLHAERIAELLPLVLAAGRPDDAGQISNMLLPLLNPDSRARVGLAVARQLTESDFQGAIDETTAALAIPGVSDETKVQLLAVRALNYANKADAVGLRRSLQEAREVADDERDGLALATIDATESVLLFNQNQFHAADRLQRQALDRMIRDGNAAGLWLPEGLWMAFMRNSLGHGMEALRIIETGLIEASAASNVIAEAYWMMVRARTLFDLGRLEEARTQAETVLDLASDLGLGDFTNATAGIVLHRVAIYTGDNELLESTRPLVEQLARSTGLTRTGRWSLAIEAIVAGDLHTAYDLSALARESLTDPIPSMNTPADFADDITLAYVCGELGETAPLDVIVDVAKDRATRNPVNNLVQAVAAATEGIRERSAKKMLDAVVPLQSAGRPLVEAQLLECAVLYGLDKEAMTTALMRALDIYEGSGATRAASRVLQTLRHGGVRTRLKSKVEDTSGLTLREHQVAERIAAGLTTKQIALDLALSPHTVVTHIRHIYEKWGINTRREVAQRVRDLAEQNGKHVSPPTIA